MGKLKVGFAQTSFLENFGGKWLTKRGCR